MAQGPPFPDVQCRRPHNIHQSVVAAFNIGGITQAADRVFEGPERVRHELLHDIRLPGNGGTDFVCPA